MCVCARVGNVRAGKELVFFARPTVGTGSGKCLQSGSFSNGSFRFGGTATKVHFWLVFCALGPGYGCVLDLAEHSHTHTHTDTHTRTGLPTEADARIMNLLS